MSPSIEATCRRLVPFYDVLYGVGLQHGRNRAMARLQPRPGEWILEVGVGTGFAQCVTRARVARRALHHVGLCRMDAACLGFPDGRFDAVYAPYLINVVPDPMTVVREMPPVCRQSSRSAATA